jgi:hypothetical protein
MNKQQILDSIDWLKVMQAPRNAGGHEEVFENIFGGNAVVIAKFIQNDYQGDEAFAFQFQDGTIAIMTDYFGSCSVCDSWEDANDEEAMNLIISMVTSSRIFGTLDEAIEYCENAEDDACDYPMRASRQLVDQLTNSK